MFSGLVLGAVLMRFPLFATIHPVARTGLQPNFLINVVSENFERKNFIFQSGLPEEARIKMHGKS
jgi:hypothetical protein